MRGPLQPIGESLSIFITISVRNNVQVGNATAQKCSIYLALWEPPDTVGFIALKAAVSIGMRWNSLLASDRIFELVIVKEPEND